MGALIGVMEQNTDTTACFWTPDVVALNSGAGRDDEPVGKARFSVAHPGLKYVQKRSKKQVTSDCIEVIEELSALFDNNLSV